MAHRPAFPIKESAVAQSSQLRCFTVYGDGQRIEQLAWMRFLKIMDDKDQEQEMLHDGIAGYGR